ncbi:hypothetical protein BVC80_1405g10 [Macleaya cordata]|uniref:Uncharacterized protein n=1 Tax=Macleaya cordata TaxID=56857 RepID=A0A200QEH9_MACCD|nr:hypothetical protein BVC80_1405g10 [Macleaya cordata]
MAKVTVWFIRSLWGSDNFDWACVPSNGRSGGIILIWDDSLMKKEGVFVGNHSVSVEISVVGDEFRWVLSSAYALNSAAEKILF